MNIISGSEEIRIGEIGEIIETLQEKAGQEADIIWGNGYDERLGDKISVTILATGFDTNPNSILQPKQETEKFTLKEEPTQTKEEIDEDPFKDMSNEPPKKKQEEKETIIISPPPVDYSSRKKEKDKKKRARKEKSRKDEPVTESNVDNWFFKNFGKLFDDDDQSMD